MSTGIFREGRMVHNSMACSILRADTSQSAELLITVDTFACQLYD